MRNRISRHHQQIALWHYVAFVDVINANATFVPFARYARKLLSPLSCRVIAATQDGSPRKRSSSAPTPQITRLREIAENTLRSDYWPGGSRIIGYRLIGGSMRGKRAWLDKCFFVQSAQG